MVQSPWFNIVQSPNSLRRLIKHVRKKEDQNRQVTSYWCNKWSNKIHYSRKLLFRFQLLRISSSVCKSETQIGMYLVCCSLQVCRQELVLSPEVFMFLKGSLIGMEWSRQASWVLVDSCYKRGLKVRVASKASATSKAKLEKEKKKTAVQIEKSVG